MAPEFALALRSILDCNVRNELEVKEIEAPANLAKHAVAFSCDVRADSVHERIDLGTGRLVLLWDEEPQESWGSRFRVIAFAKSPLETEIGADEYSSGMAWSWLVTALDANQATYNSEAGTSTRVISTGFGALSNQSPHAELELRASWSPLDTNLAAHMHAWQSLICMMSGLPLQNEDVGRLNV
ncbi:unannotated protein [freshwater metagenome]|uniref:Unannotated protein n=1 Tax=freshwater metagenome TaxID=449393 RepID=A0A6J6HK56_9ZZZZ